MAQDLTTFVALQVQSEGIGLLLTGKIGTDVALVLDDWTPIPPDPTLTNFSLETYPTGPGAHPVSLWIRMTFDQLHQLFVALKAQSHQLPPGLNPVLFHTFVQQVEVELGNKASNRFNDARFTSVARDTGGAIVGHFGLGVDVVGTIHDSVGAITVEQHVVPMPPGRFRRLSRADRLSLAAALNAYIKAVPTADPLWKQIAQDAAA